MKVINLGGSNSVINTILAQMRDTEIQKDSAKFRNNLYRLGQFFGYEVSKTLGYSPADVTTPLGVARMEIQTDRLVIATILRAGLSLQQGIQSVFDNAESAFLSAYRIFDNDHNIRVITSYCATPSLCGKTLILADTMLATGTSLLDAIDIIKEKGGEPACLHLVCPISSARAIENLQQSLSDDVTLWVAAIDPELNSDSYIVPGLGDAGDLCFGEKL